MDKLILGLFLVFLIVLPSYALADPSTYLNIPPTNAFDKIHSDNGTISAVNFSMPLTIKGGSGITVQSSNGSHTVIISGSASPSTNKGTYNQTLSNNIPVNTNGNRLNFINGTNNPLNIVDDPTRNQVNITISSTGSGGSGVTSVNSQTGPSISIVRELGNTTITNSTNQIKVGLGVNPVITGGAAQTVTKPIKLNQLNASSSRVDDNDNTKKLTWLLSGMTTGKTLTIRSNQTTSQGLNIPDISATDTLATLKSSQTFTGVNKFSNNMTVGNGVSNFFYLRMNNGFGGDYPTPNPGGAIGWNFQSAGVDFWNTFNTAPTSFAWRQLNTATSQTTLMTLSPIGALTTFAQQIWLPISDPTTASTNAIWKSSTNADVLKYRNNANTTTYNILSTLGAVTTSTPADPSGTTSTTAKMMGLAGSITPAVSTRIDVTICGQMANSLINDGVTVQLRYGTGTAPANGATLTGTQLGASQTNTEKVAAQNDGFCVTGIATGLTIGTAYWLDTAVNAVTAGTASITGITIKAHEI